MSGTNPTTRSAPTRTFENYIFTRVVDTSVGLTDVEDKKFSSLYRGQTPGDSNNPAFGGVSDAVSLNLPLGFEFVFDGIKYNYFAVHTSGWMALVNPGSTSINSAAFIDAGTWVNEIRPTFNSNDKSVLLAPWFMWLRNTYTEPSQLLTAPGSVIYANRVNNIAAGLEPAPPVLTKSSKGVRWLPQNSKDGRRVIIRWTSTSMAAWPMLASSVLRFEVVIYENGKIEFRYAPRIANTNIVSPSEISVCGIFMPNGTNRFRDFSAGLNYTTVKHRQEYIYGGYVYDAAFNDVSNDPDYWETIYGGPHTSPYVSNLNPMRNWPAVGNAGCVMTFSPPVKRRRVLPRKLIHELDNRITRPLVARVGDSRLGTNFSSYDDRKSPIWSQNSSVSVNYPTTLTRFNGGDSQGTLEQQNLFSGDLLAPGNVNKSSVGQFIAFQSHDELTPSPAFNESSRFEQSHVVESGFYASGSSITNLTNGFDKSLKSKTQVKISLPVVNDVQMPGMTSSIYYYNQKTKSWNVPVKSAYTLNWNSTSPTSPAGDWTDVGMLAAPGALLLSYEDAKGFGPVGNIVSSGSRVLIGGFGYAQSSDPNIGVLYNKDSYQAAIGTSYAKSVRTNKEYTATDDETFTLPISSPFLIEKAVFEIPLMAGPGWFNDITQCFFPRASSIFPTQLPNFLVDFAGPALTVALYRQVQLSKNHSDAPFIRDLILTGTITHINDHTSSLAVEAYPTDDSSFVIRPTGFLAYANPPGSVINDRGKNQFTGSAVVESTAMSSAGVLLNYIKRFDHTDASINAARLSKFTLNPEIDLSINRIVDETEMQLCHLANAAPIGRGASGFDQAGRAILGNDLATMQGLYDKSGTKIANPFSGTNNFHLNDLMNSCPQSTCATYVVSLITHFPSPYLVMPGDKLVLSISKMRPVTYQPLTQHGVFPEVTFTYNADKLFSGSIAASGGHDVVLSTGSINVTLYGSQMQAGVEFHDTLNQPLGSDAVHEIIGAEPVLDQFEVAYRNEYSGSFTDNVVLGTLDVNLTNRRSQKVSKVSASLYPTTIPAHDITNEIATGTETFHYAEQIVWNSFPPTLSLSEEDLAISKSKAYRLQPWTEKTGNVRVSQFVDESERYWDSMPPALDKCFAADGSAIFMTSTDDPRYSAFGDTRQIITASIGRIMLDVMLPSFVTYAGVGINGNWCKSFPFEPRYEGSSRQLDVSTTFNATYMYNPANFPLFKPIDPTPCTGLIFGTTSFNTAIEPALHLYLYFVKGPCYEWFADCDVSAKTSLVHYKTSGISDPHPFTDTFPAEMYVTGSPSLDDTIKGLYGFGDKNTSYSYEDFYPGSNMFVTLGSNHFPESRDCEGPHPDIGFLTSVEDNYFHFSPVIRGWKYGLVSGLPTFSKSYWRRGKFGQFRDMLEQRPYAKYYQSPEKSTTLQDENFHQGVGTSVVTVTFVDQHTKKTTQPENTFSSNLHFECTSSMPFFDGRANNRPTVTGPKGQPIIRLNTLNLQQTMVLQDDLGNIRIS